MGSSGPPATGTVQKRGAAAGAHVARPEADTIDFPSGVQPSTTSGPGCHVSRRGSPPSAETTYTSRLPAYSPLNASHLPSGEKRGLLACPWKLVSRRASPPARGTIQMFCAYANAICVALTVGERSIIVWPAVFSAATGADADATRVAASSSRSVNVRAGRRSGSMGELSSALVGIERARTRATRSATRLPQRPPRVGVLPTDALADRDVHLRRVAFQLDGVAHAVAA